VSNDSGFDLLPIQLRVAQPKIPWKRVTMSILSESDETWADGSPWPSVNAVNAFGHERKLVELPTKKEATARLAEVREDLESLGLRDWCEKYDVPWSFLTDGPPDWYPSPTDEFGSLRWWDGQRWTDLNLAYSSSAGVVQ
jgi:hypothetical protein